MESFSIRAIHFPMYRHSSGGLCSSQSGGGDGNKENVLSLRGGPQAVRPTNWSPPLLANIYRYCTLPKLHPARKNMLTGEGPPGWLDRLFSCLLQLPNFSLKTSAEIRNWLEYRLWNHHTPVTAVLICTDSP